MLEMPESRAQTHVPRAGTWAHVEVGTKNLKTVPQCAFGSSSGRSGSPLIQPPLQWPYYVFTGLFPVNSGQTVLRTAYAPTCLWPMLRKSFEHRPLNWAVQLSSEIPRALFLNWATCP